jgi:hypothetical protein
MKNFFKFVFISLLSMASIVYLSGCDDDEDDPKLTGDNTVFDLAAVGNSTASGTVTFAKRDDNKTVVTIQLSGTQATGDHPAHIHANTAAEGGSIVLSLENVSGSNGKSETIVMALDDGTSVTYEELIEFDGYVNVHTSESDLGTLVAQGDIGQNALTGDSEVYNLGAVSDPAISGTVKFEKRENNETLVTIALNGTTAGGTHPAHIHANSLAQSGGIAVDLSAVDGATGISKTNISKLNDNTTITYDQLLNFNGYAQVHLSSTSLGTILANGDIGMNELTGVQKVYQMGAVGASGISGTVTFAERKSGFTLVTIDLTGTADINRVAHIHANSVAQTGAVVKDLSVVNGTIGKSFTHVAALNDGTPITYAQLLTYNGYAQVHISPTGGAPVANADIGNNELTGTQKIYPMNSVNASGISGTVTFAERKSGFTLVTIDLTGTADINRVAHIHANSVAVTGAVVKDLSVVNGTTGKSFTHVAALNDGTAITYAQLLTYNGYAQVHISPTGGAAVANGNIGSNAP